MNDTQSTDMEPVGSEMVSMLERAAKSPDIDVQKLEKLLDMQERILNRNALMAFNAAFSDMQSMLPVITERGEIKVGDTVRSRYAKFEDINEAVKPILKQHGFGLNFHTHTDNEKIKVTGVLMHREGHSVETDMELPADNSGSKNSVQSIGSSVSYAKRYVMCALLNITSRGEDDDAESIERITEVQAADIKSLIKKVGADEYKFLKYLKVDSVENIPAKAYQYAVDALERKRK